ncbi:hypothetical protein NC652_001219 [Populus alba x Populus x berolinensis]|nr:hypothetical protein NC652_001219 [Populus alba x Populus x berolinensis]
MNLINHGDWYFNNHIDWGLICSYQKPTHILKVSFDSLTPSLSFSSLSRKQLVSALLTVSVFCVDSNQKLPRSQHQNSKPPLSPQISLRCNHSSVSHATANLHLRSFPRPFLLLTHNSSLQNVFTILNLAIHLLPQMLKNVHCFF